MNIVYPLTPAILALMAPLVFFLTDQVKAFVPESPRQNAIMRLISVAIGAAVGVACLPLIPGLAMSYANVAGAAIQGGAIGGGVTLSVLAAYAVKAEPAAPTK